MGNVRLSRFSCINRLAEGPLAPHVDAFKRYLTDRGYAASTFANCVGSIAHFAQWIHGQRLRVQCIDEAVVAEFLDEHLVCCRCSGAVQRDRRGLSAALGHLLVVLRAQGVIAPLAVSAYADDIPSARGILWKVPSGAWVPHFTAMDPGTYDAPFDQARGFQLAVSSAVVHAFVGT